MLAPPVLHTLSLNLKMLQLPRVERSGRWIHALAAVPISAFSRFRQILLRNPTPPLPLRESIDVADDPPEAVPNRLPPSPGSLTPEGSEPMIPPPPTPRHGRSRVYAADFPLTPPPKLLDGVKHGVRFSPLLLSAVIVRGRAF